MDDRKNPPQINDGTDAFFLTFFSLKTTSEFAQMTQHVANGSL